MLIQQRSLRQLSLKQPNKPAYVIGMASFRWQEQRPTRLHQIFSFVSMINHLWITEANEIKMGKGLRRLEKLLREWKSYGKFNDFIQTKSSISIHPFQS